jgi:uncharacterized protein YjgD (DUF1641 family)
MATAVPVEDQITEIHRKLDLIVEEMEHMRRVRRSVDDLQTDLLLVARDAYKKLTDEFSTTEVHPEEIVELVKVALSNADRLTSALRTLESVDDFLQDFHAVAKDMYSRAIVQFQTMQEQGWTDAVVGGARIANTLVQSHSADDMRQIEASLPHLVGLMRQLTRPEVLQALEAIVFGFGRVQATMNVDKSVLQIVRELNSPEARRGMGILIEFLKVVGARSAGPAA